MCSLPLVDATYDIISYNLIQGLAMQSKICTKCGIEKNIDSFSMREKGGRLYKSRCDECERLRARTYKIEQSLTPIGQYKQHKDNAIMRGVEFNLTFEDWHMIWEESGKYSQRGRGKDKYCMCRINDSGAYEKGNVFIDTNTRNISDGNIGKTMSVETRTKISNGNKGKEHFWSKGENNPMHRPEVKAKLSLAISGAKHYKAIGVITPFGDFDTAKLASEATGIKRSTIEWRARHNKFGFSYNQKLSIA